MRNVVGVEVDYSVSDSGQRFYCWLTLSCGHKVLQRGRRGLREAPAPHPDPYVWSGGKKRCDVCAVNVAPTPTNPEARG